MDFKKEIVKPEGEGFVVYASDFGVSENNADNHKALSDLLSYCTNNNVKKLVIPKGKYYFATKKPILMKDIEDLVLDCSDSEFIYCITGEFFKIENCNKICIKNLYLDWDWDTNRLASVVKVIHMSKDKGYVDFEYLEDGELDLSQNWVTTNEMDAITLTPGCEDGLEYGAYKNDSETFERKEKIAPKTYRCYKDLSDCEPLHLKDGSIHIVRHYLYNGGVFSIISSSHVTMENITIYSSPGFGYAVGGHTHHLFMDRCNIVLKPNSNRRITTTADGFHVGQSNGYLLFENCDFGFHGDDCINIHDNVKMYIEKESKDTLSVSRIFVSKQGDDIEFRNSDLSPMNLFNKIKSVFYNQETDKTTLVFENDLPENLPSNTILFNRAFNSGPYHIKNCYFHETRARGVLAQANNGVIENCRFYKIQGAAIQIETGASSRWSEGMGVDNLIIRNNEIKSCDVNDWGKAVLYMSTFLPEGIARKKHGTDNPTSTLTDSGANYRTAYPMFTNIEISNNVFEEYPRRAMILSSFNNLKIYRNLFINEIPRKKKNAERGSIWVELGKNLVFLDNNYQISPLVVKKMVEIDTETTENIKVFG